MGCVIRRNHVHRAVQRVHQLEHLIRRGLAVVVQADDDVALAGPVTGHEGGVLAEVADHAQALHPPVGGGQLLNDLPGVIRRVVVGQNHLKVVAAIGLHGAADVLHHGGEGLGAVVAGNDKTEQLFHGTLPKNGRAPMAQQAENF